MTRYREHARLMATALRDANYQTGGLTDNARTVLARRYLKKDDRGRPTETPDDMFRRVAHDLAQAELDPQQRPEVEARFYDLMTSGRFLPNSPTLMNAGRDLQQLSACFVLPVDDSLDSIFRTLQHTALIHKSGGGTGFDFSKLRPEGDLVGTTQGVASGPVSFIEPFDHATEVIKQGGTRRGANMGILRCDHPEILKFISRKNDGRHLQNFNISVAVTDRFMAAADNGEDYDLIHPVSGAVTGRLNARLVLEQISQCAWQTGDPGLVFIDRINETHPNAHIGPITATNPCVHGDTWVQTDDGPRRIRDLAGQAVNARCDGQDLPAHGVRTGYGAVLRLDTSEGHHLKLTPDHRVMTDQGWLPAAELQPGQAVRLHDHSANNRWGKDLPERQRTLAYLTGALLAGGHYCPEAEHAILTARDDEQARIQTQALRAVSTPAETDCRHPASPEPLNRRTSRNRQLARYAARYGIRPGRIAVTPQAEQECSDFSRSLAAGCIDHSDCTAESGHLLITVDHQAVPAGLQKVLARLGVTGRRTDPHTLALDIRQLAAAGLPLQHPRLLEQLPPAPENPAESTPRYAHVRSVTPAGDTPLYDMTVPGLQAYDANGLYVHNCGEQPLQDYESCNLGSLNIAAMLRYDPATQTYRQDDAELENAVTTAVRMLDNVIDRNRWPVAEIATASRNSRRIGLGLMGWADALIMMGLPYDSPEACQLAETVMSRFRELTHQASAELARERGNYPNWDGSAYQQQGQPMRNTAPTTIAPTGTISVIAGASSGIEPLFALAYTRNVLEGHRLAEYNPLLDVISRYYQFDTPSFRERLLAAGSLEDTEAPGWVKEVFRVSHQIAPPDHIRMQAAFQAHTDNAVSKTVNLPNSATDADVLDAYRLAYRLGCKGITVYRDGSKAGQVLTVGAGNGDAGAEGKPSTPTVRPRPRTLIGRTHRFRTGHGNLYVIVNRDENEQPFELFTQVGKAGGCDAAHLEAISRLASLALRLGATPDLLTEQLRHITCCPAWDEGRLIRSIPDGIAHALADDSGETLTAGPPPGTPACPECHAPTHFAEGCQVCPACHWSRCE